MGAVEAVYNPHLNFDIILDSVSYVGFFWNPQSFGGMDQDPAPGDIVIAMVTCRTDDEGTYVPNLRIADDDGNERTDWAQWIDTQFDNDGSGFVTQDPSYDDPHFTGVLGAHYAIALFTKVWTADDDPATYDAYFTGYNADGDGFSAEVQMVMYCIHGGDGHVSVDWNEITTGFFESPNATFTRNFGDGASWGWKEPSSQTDGFGTWGYYPGAAYAVVAGTGASVYCRTAFGKWAFFTAEPESFDVEPNNQETMFLEPNASVDGDWGTTAVTSTRDPLRAFTVVMDDFVGSVVKASRRFSAIHRISVS